MSMTRTLWSIALPAMLTNVATALFGLADVWVIGRLGDAAAQGGVELGAKFMMGLLVVFNFLRMGTIGLTAQAAGRSDEAAQAETLARAVAIALLIGLALLAFRPLAVPLGLEALGARGAVEAQARDYAEIRYWGGTPWLVNAALTGWLIGRRRVRAVLGVEVGANALHVALDFALVLGGGLGVVGVAVSTLASEGAKLLALAAVVAREAPARAALLAFRRAATWRRDALAPLFRVNRDLFLRTLLLTLAIMIFARGGADQGATALAANAILFQLFMLAALVLDGFESAAQVLCGEAVGARDRAAFAAALRANIGFGLVLALAISFAYATLGRPFAASFSTDPAVVAAALAYLPWAAVLPLVGVASFVLDGAFVGATWTRAMLLTMAAALLAYLALRAVAAPLGNHGLWLAFTLFFAARAAGQAIALPRLVRATFAPMIDRQRHA